jgi:hypothetical protein
MPPFELAFLTFAAAALGFQIVSNGLAIHRCRRRVP